MSDFPLEGAIEHTADGAAKYIEALRLAEVQEAVLAHANTLVEAFRALERAGLPRQQVAAILGGEVHTVAMLLADDP